MRIVVHSYVPAPGAATTGGFDWGRDGTLGAEEVRAQFALSTNTAHHDFLPTHEHRLLHMTVPELPDAEAVNDHIEQALLDSIEAGEFDGIFGVDVGHFKPEAPANSQQIRMERQ